MLKTMVIPIIFIVNVVGVDVVGVDVVGVDVVGVDVVGVDVVGFILKHFFYLCLILLNIFKYAYE